jgi:uncharacterized protein
VKELKNFNIEIYKLSNGTHEYEFPIDEKFFEFFNYGLMEGGKGTSKVKLKKSETFIETEIKIEATIDLVCDRSLEVFPFSLNETHKMMFKYGDREEEITDEITIIPRDTQRLNMAQYIYEFMTLGIPMKKLHPRFKDAEYQENEEGILIYSSGPAEESAEDKDIPEDDIDPRWKILKKLKDGNN